MRCVGCGKESASVSEALGVCGDCLVKDPARYEARVFAAHANRRREDCLPAVAPKSVGGTVCEACRRACSLGEGETGYCVVRRNRKGIIGHLRGPDSALCHCRYEPIPTNCAASWVCGESGPTCRNGTADRALNLAVFYAGCNLDCLFCRNSSHRMIDGGHEVSSPPDVARMVTSRTSCVCFFGGDPAPSVEHALRAATLAIESSTAPPRICWETNGLGGRRSVERMARLSLGTGGCVKVDFKVFSPAIFRALCDFDSPRGVMENIEALVSMAPLRPRPPLLVVSTPLIPGYVTRGEVSAIAGFLASLNPDIPYSLLGFSPNFMMADMPRTSREHAAACAEAAREAGLTNVHVGNLASLGDAVYD